jgi:hypothetical protein
MMNQATPQGVDRGGFIDYDFSHGSTNTYRVEARHNLIPRCLHCGKGSRVLLDGTEYYNYFMRGAKIQDAFPTLTAAQREVLMTGTHPACWDEMTRDPEDQDLEDRDLDLGGQG